MMVGEALAAGEDFFGSRFGTLSRLSWRNRRLGPLTDAVFDARLRLNNGRQALRRDATNGPACKVLIATVEVPGREAETARVLQGLARTRHHVEFATIKMGDRGKFDNINAALEGIDVAQYDWLVVTDDDITTPDGLLDQCLHLAAKGDLKIFQPAHCFNSYTTFKLTHRHWNRLARVTHFVESGPLTGFHRDMVAKLLPFPSMRWAWGLDVYWSEIARAEGWNIGIIDALPIRHLRPIANSYGFFTAMEEARGFLRRHGIDRPKEEILRTVQAI
jgi:hypothetical protein